MFDCTLEIKLGLRGPVITQNSQPESSVASSWMMKDHRGRYCLPSSLLKGVLREGLEELCDCLEDDRIFDKKAITRLLGKASDEYAPESGALSFQDLVCDSSDTDPTGSSYRIKINDSTGTVDSGAILIIDSPFPPGKLITFTGKILFMASKEADAKHTASIVGMGLRWMDNLGAYKSVGFGCLESVSLKLSLNKINLGNNIPAPLQQDKLALELYPQNPFCISKRRVNENLFESEQIIPGGAIIGALASTLMCLADDGKSNSVADLQFESKDLQCLVENFDLIHITHAFPVQENAESRPVHYPLSLVKLEVGPNTKIVDAAAYDTDFFTIEKKAPKFSVDWKDCSDVATAYGWSSPAFAHRMHVHLDRANHTSIDGDLFAYKLVVPDEHKWLCRIDLSALPEENKQSVARALSIILNEVGLISLGKTKTRVNVKLRNVDSDKTPDRLTAADTIELHDGRVLQRPSPYYYPENERTWIITLQTQGVMLNPSDLNDDLILGYNKFFSGISGNSLKLTRFFAQQSLAGGRYLFERFQRNWNNYKCRDKYEPYVMTDPGSVFILEATGDVESAAKYIKLWNNSGLPLPDWAKAKYGEKWNQCPFIPQNGYGEIHIRAFEGGDL